MSNLQNNDVKLQMRLNIQHHRQKLLSYLKNTNDIVLRPKIKLVSNNLEKLSSQQNVQPKIASRAEKLLSPKLDTAIKVVDYETRTTIQVKKIKPVINTTAEHSEVSTNISVIRHITRSTVTVKQLQPDIKVELQDELPSVVELPLEPIQNIKIKDPKPPPVVIKKLKKQLLEELYDSSSSDEINDNIYVGNNEDWNDFNQPLNKSDKNENDSSNSSNSSLNSADEDEQSTSDESEEEYLSDSGDSLNIKKLNTKKENGTKIKKKSARHRFKKPEDRSIHNSKERAYRDYIAKRFHTLLKFCSYLNISRRLPSKHSILLAAKKECELLKHFEKKMLNEKKTRNKENKILKKKLRQIIAD